MFTIFTSEMAKYKDIEIIKNFEEEKEFSINQYSHSIFMKLVNQSSGIKLLNLKILDNNFKANFERFFEILNTFIQNFLKQFYEKVGEKELMNILEILYIKVSQ
jgi:hypothetical protein